VVYVTPLNTQAKLFKSELLYLTANNNNNNNNNNTVPNSK